MSLTSRLTILALLVLQTIAPVPASAITKDDSRSVRYDTVWLDDKEYAALCGGGGAGPGAGGNLPEGIPTIWRDLIMAAAPKHPDADPRLVASVLWAENRGWPEYKTSGWKTSPAGAQGPWQFMPSTWASMGYDGNGDGVKNPQDPADAVHAAFEHHKGSAGKPIAGTGFTGANADNDYQTTIFQRNRQNLLSFAANYNGRGAPDNTAIRLFPSNENSNYVKINFWLLATNFQKGWIPEGDKFVNAGSTTAGPTAGTAGLCANSTTAIVNTDGYSFPVAPQRKSQNGSVAGLSQLPCTGAISTCHHDRTPAFDLGAEPGGDQQVGTPIYAISAGTITSVKDNYKGNRGCFSISFKSSKDQYNYWHGHLQNARVSPGQQVAAGTQIAEIGRRACTGNGSTPHLHIDRGCVVNGVFRPGGSDSCRDPGIVPLMNSLFNALPE